MTVYDLCNRINTEYKIALNKYAKRLGAEEMTIHPDKSITLENRYGYICCNYKPTLQELYKNKEERG